jgi:hypothetical protein
MIEFIALIHSTRKYMRYSAIADLHTLQFTVTQTLGFSVFTSRILATDFNTVLITHKVFSSQANFQISTELVTISILSHLASDPCYTASGRPQQETFS